MASVAPAGRSVHLNLSEIDRPKAFSMPLAPRDFGPVYCFEIDSEAGKNKVVGRFEAWLRPLPSRSSSMACRTAAQRAPLDLEDQAFAPPGHGKRGDLTAPMASMALK